ncbi:hypothetical protein CEW46_29265 [Bacillus cereus]|nr:hypothetical protein CEW46_29265 [Bacillus cereus]
MNEVVKLQDVIDIINNSTYTQWNLINARSDYEYSLIEKLISYLAVRPLKGSPPDVIVLKHHIDDTYIEITLAYEDNTGLFEVFFNQYYGRPGTIYLIRDIALKVKHDLDKIHNVKSVVKYRTTKINWYNRRRFNNYQRYYVEESE